LVRFSSDFMTLNQHYDYYVVDDESLLNSKRSVMTSDESDDDESVDKVTMKKTQNLPMMRESDENEEEEQQAIVSSEISSHDSWMSTMEQLATNDVLSSTSSSFVFKGLNITGGINRVYLDNARVLGVLSFQSTSGRIEMNNVNSTVTVGSVSGGRLVINQMSSMLSILAAAGGNIIVDHASARGVGNFTASTTSGKIVLTDISDAKFITATTKKGRITVMNSESNFQGRFHVKTNGRLTLVNGTMNAVTFDAEQPEKKFASGYIGADNGNLLQLTATSGSITVDLL